MTRPRFSTQVVTALVLVAALLVGAAILLDWSAESRGGKAVVTVRLWDQQVASAYRQSFEAFERAHPDIEVRTNVVEYATYFDTLRTDVAGGSADDIFWLNNAYLAGYADSGRLMSITVSASVWEPSVVEQFTRNGVLWGVPQLTDAGIAVYYNADLLAAAGVDPAQLNTTRWSPGGADTLRPLLARLTVDADGHAANTPGFDPRRVRQFGYNAANDPQGIYLNYIGSAGGVFQSGDRFAFDNPDAVQAFGYLVGLINDDHVSPPASDTNDNGDFSRNQFLAGRMALFQSGTYNLAAVADHAGFRWGLAMLPAGPAGPGQCHQRHCCGREFGVQASRRGSSGAGLDGQRARQRISGASRHRDPRRAGGAACLLRLLGGQGRRRLAVLPGAERPADRGAGGCRLPCRKPSSQAVFRRDVPGPQRCCGDAASGADSGQRRGCSLGALS